MERMLAEMHPAFLWLFGIAAVSIAVTAIWKTWLGSVVASIRVAVVGIIEMVTLMRDIKTDVGGVHECMQEIVDELKLYGAQLHSHGEQLDDYGQRIERLEEHVLRRIS